MDDSEFNDSTSEEKKALIGYQKVKNILGRLIDFINFSNDCLVEGDLTKCSNDVSVSTDEIPFLWEKPFKVERNYLDGDGEQPYVLYFTD